MSDGVARGGPFAARGSRPDAPEAPSYRRPGAAPAFGPRDFFDTADEALALIDARMAVLERLDLADPLGTDFDALRRELTNAREIILTLYREALRRQAKDITAGLLAIRDAVANTYAIAFHLPSSAPDVTPRPLATPQEHAP